MRVMDLADRQKYPAVSRFLEYQVEMQFADLRVMLQLPRSDLGLAAGCNFAAASVLLNLLSGFSVCLYDASVAALQSRAGKGERFLRLLTAYYPWDGEDWNPQDGSKWLYQVARNPLAHSLGVYYPASGERPRIAKMLLLPTEIEELERKAVRPSFAGLTIYRVQLPTGQKVVDLSVPCLYWGTWRLLDKLVNDPTQVAQADQFLSQLGI